MEITISNDVRIQRNADKFAVDMMRQPTPNDIPLKVEVDYRGRRLKEEFFNPCMPYEDGLSLSQMGRINPQLCHIRVHRGDQLLAELPAPADETPAYPYMVSQGPQVHVTENYVSSPPALTITDSQGAIWSLGIITALEHESPKGEFAFSVLRNGFSMGIIASRIERRNNKIRTFTKRGWLVFNGREFL